MCWYLCHGFARCTRSISLPICIKYAKLAAERARNWLRNVEKDESGSDTSSNVDGGGGMNDDLERQYNGMLDVSRLCLNENSAKTNAMKSSFYFT